MMGEDNFTIDLNFVELGYMSEQVHVRDDLGIKGIITLEGST